MSITQLQTALRLATRTVLHEPLGSLAQTLALSLLFLGPVLLTLLGARTSAQMHAQLQSLPVVVAAPGQSLPATLALLGLDQPGPPALPLTAVRDASAYAPVAAMRFAGTASDAPLWAVEPDWYALRALSLAQGRPPALIAEVALGATLAKQLGAQPGAALWGLGQDPLDPSHAPVRLTVVGLLAPCRCAEDALALTSLPTAELLDGTRHAHQPDGEPTVDPTGALDPTALPPGALHGHATTPLVHAALAVPPDARARDLLLAAGATSPSWQASDTATLLGPHLDRLSGLSALSLQLALLSSLGGLGIFASLAWADAQARQPALHLLHQLGMGRPAQRLFLAARLGILLAASALLVSLILIFI